MGVDGTYGFVYCGNRGLGMGVFSINGEHVVGRDLAGSTYYGTAVKDADGNIVLDVQMQIGVTLVQGTALQGIPHARQICWTFPPAFGDGEPQMVEFAGPTSRRREVLSFGHHCGIALQPGIEPSRHRPTPRS